MRSADIERFAADRDPRARRLIALVLALTVGAGTARAASAKSTADHDDGEHAIDERRAVRGSSVDDAGAETPELRELRRFEEQAFPHPGAGSATAASARPPGDSPLPPSALPGEWGGSGDVPAEMRSPEPPPAAGSAVVAPDSEWLRGLKLPDIPVRWDPQVLRYLDYFKNDPKGRLVMANWLRRAGRYRELFQRTLAVEGLPKDLFYVAMVESGFDCGARSRVGAGGIWQFMPGAARAYGIEVSYWFDGRRDPELSAQAAARYLKDLYVRFGSWYLVFAAYNAGYGAVLRSIATYNTNDFWELARHESGLPWESSLYVPKILAAAIVGNNAQAFGYGDVATDAPLAYEEVDVPPGTSLASVARAAGTKQEVIEALNPQLARGRTPPDRGPTKVRLPPGTAAGYAAGFEKTRGADKLDTVVLRFGETLEDVARAHGTTARELKKLNGVKDTVELRGGMAIVAPRRGGSEKSLVVVAATEAAEPADNAKPAGATADDESIVVAVPDRSFSYDGRERVFYRTRDGDSLDEIADVFGVRPEDLVEWNNLDPGAKLHPRMVLQIFVRKDFDPAGVVLLDPNHVRVVTLGSEEFLGLEAARRGRKRLYYDVKAGDTLAKLGRRYGLTPGDLARINRFSYNTELHEGDRIVVYSPAGDAPHEVTRGLTPAKKRPERSPAASAALSKTGATARKTAAVDHVVSEHGERGHRTTGASADGKKKPGTSIAKTAPAVVRSTGKSPARAAAKPGAKKK
jgi:peptidoglycan lytic transglycosylase D